MVVYLNGKFIAKENAFISVMDRGFLFGDSVYEIIPVYEGNIFRFDLHFKRLEKSLNSIKISNPKTYKEWLKIANKIISYNKYKNQYIYLQITRGFDNERSHTYEKLKPTVYMESSNLESCKKEKLMSGFFAITREDIRWEKVNIKANSLVANIMYAQEAKDNNVEEIILLKDNIVTECSSSNIFIVKDNVIYTHPKDCKILSGITREVIIESAINNKTNLVEKAFTKKDLFDADEVWISSSKREILPITKIDNIKINNGKIGNIWSLIYDEYQLQKNKN